jgi:hypothetical protein
MRRWATRPSCGSGGHAKPRHNRLCWLNRGGHSPTPWAHSSLEAWPRSRWPSNVVRLVERWAGMLVSDGYGVYRTWLHGRLTCLAHLIRRARGLSERHDPEIAGFGHRALAAWQRLVHWATAPPTSGDVQTWDARTVHLSGQSRHRHDTAGTFARTLEREMGFLWTCVVEAGVEAHEQSGWAGAAVCRALAQDDAGDLQ